MSRGKHIRLTASLIALTLVLLVALSACGTNAAPAATTAPAANTPAAGNTPAVAATTAPKPSAKSDDNL